MTDDELRHLFETLRQENAAAHVETRRELGGEITEVRGETAGIRGEIMEIRGEITEMRGDITEMRGDITEMRGDITEMRGDITEMRGDITEMHGDITETRRHIDVVNEATRHEIRLVAEAVQYFREELGQTESRLDEKIDRSISETQALIRFSHAQLDQRLRILEQRM